MPLKKLTRQEQWRIAGHILKGVRKARKLTQVQLAEATGVERVSISQAEGGKRGLPDEHLSKFAQVLRVPEASLVAPNVIEESEFQDFVPRRLEKLLKARA